MILFQDIAGIVIRLFLSLSFLEICTSFVYDKGYILIFLVFYRMVIVVAI